MPILAFLSILNENKKKSSDKTLPLVGIEPRPFITSDSKSNTLLSTLYLTLDHLYSHALLISLKSISRPNIKWFIN